MDELYLIKDNSAIKYLAFLLVFFVLTAYGCAANSVQKVSSAEPATEQAMATPDIGAAGHQAPSPAHDPRQAAKAYRPGVAWQPSYSVSDVAIHTNEVKLPPMQVGADIHTRGGKVKLSDFMRQFAQLKGMSVNWASDVNQDLPIEVNINADDDFWRSLSGILKQLDYFYEFKDNTITVKYKDTRKFYLPMPFIETSYKTNVGGDLLGGVSNTGSGSYNSGQSGSGGGDRLKAVLSSEHNSDKVDIWVSIRENLDKMLNLATAQANQKEDKNKKEEGVSGSEQQKDDTKAGQQSQQKNTQKDAKNENKGAGDREGYFYTIDKPLGIVTVTAPRSILDQVESYFDTLKKEMSRQVVIEAKIIEVYLNNDSQKGIDWTNLLKSNSTLGDAFNFKVTFGNNGVLVPKNGAKFIGKFSIDDKAFKLFVHAMEEYGTVNILSNPKLSLMNGQSAMMTVGTSISYLDSVTSTTSTTSGTTPTITYTTHTGNILSGVGLGVMASIASEDEVLLQLTPVTSQLMEDPIEYKSFGNVDTGSGAMVGLPRVFVRELTTMARVKNGQILVLGGLIDEEKNNDDTKIPLLGDIPMVNNLFKHSHNFTRKRELIILLRPEIVNL